MRCILAFAFALCFALSANAQSIQGIVNDYTTLAGFGTCPLELQVADASAFSAGDAVLLIQTSGGSIVTGNNASFGNIASITNTGRFERAEVDSVVGNSLWLNALPVNNYNAGNTQIVRIASYTNASVNGTLTAPAFDGSTGGVLALEVAGTLTLNADIDVSGKGFAGASYVNSNNNGCLFFSVYDGYVYDISDWRASPKGEGIVPIATGMESGRGKQANGGGGGNDHNAGGGGGGNYGAGGLGGENDDPGSFNCHGYYPGIGGASLQYSNRIFMGGGGGCGHGNNNLGSAGANGGGIAIIIADSIVAAGGNIIANGLDAADAAGDGAGGGGAGGTILLDAASVAGNLSLEARGGIGGSSNNSGAPRCMGPGGGGGGGRIRHSGNSSITASAGGGQPGITFNSSDGCDGQSLGATAGGNGNIQSTVTIAQGTALPSVSISGSLSDITDCPGDADTLALSASGSNYTLHWQLNSGSGWQNLSDTGAFSGSSDSALVINALALWMDSVQFRLLGSATCAAPAVSDTLMITMLPLPELTFPPTSTVVCEQALGAIPFEATGSIDSYQWQQLTDSGWVNVSNTNVISGANSSNLIFSSAAMIWDSTEFRCEITGCGGQVYTDAVFLDVLPLPVPNCSWLVDSNMATFVSTSLLTDSVTWLFGDGNSAGPADSVTHTYTANGQYNVLFTAWNGCGAVDSSFMIAITAIDTVPIDTLPNDTGTSVLPQRHAVQWNVLLYPNPSSERVLAVATSEMDVRATALVYNLFGELVWQGRLNSNPASPTAIPVADWPAGTYIMRVGSSTSVPFSIVH